jgi:hypothetical protein
LPALQHRETARLGIYRFNPSFALFFVLSAMSLQTPRTCRPFSGHTISFYGGRINLMQPSTESKTLCELPFAIINQAENELYGYALLEYFDTHPGANLNALLLEDLGMEDWQIEIGLAFILEIDEEGEYDGILQ